MFFLDKLSTHTPTISFEFFPPKTPDGWAKLYATIAETTALDVDLVSVTYGAGGSTRENTVDLVGSLQNNLGITTMAHLTCLGHSQVELAKLLEHLVTRHVPMIMALRGDPPQGRSTFKPHPYGFKYASDLIGFIRDGWPDFKIGCAAYPEGHPESQSAGSDQAITRDIEFLKIKQDQGADFAVTQMFFDNTRYFEFVERARAAGVTIPLLPGIMPLQRAAQVERFVTLAGCTIPAALQAIVADNQVAEGGFKFALQQCLGLLQGGAPGIHLYTLNESVISSRLLTALRKAKCL